MDRKRLVGGILAVALLLMPLLGCAPATPPPAELSPCSVSFAYIDPVFLGGFTDPAQVTKEKKVSVINVGLTVSNPNETTVTITSIPVELKVNGFSWGMTSCRGNVYIPPGKEVMLRFSYVVNTFSLIQQVMLGKGTTVPDAVKTVLGTLASVEAGKAEYEIETVVAISSESGTTLIQNFEYTNK